MFSHLARSLDSGLDQISGICLSAGCQTRSWRALSALIKSPFLVQAILPVLNHTLSATPAFQSLQLDARQPWSAPSASQGARKRKAAQSRQLQKPKPVVPVHRILSAPGCRVQNQWLHCVMSSAELTVLFLPVSVAQYHPFCLTVSPESNAPQTRHSDISRSGGFSCFSPDARRGASFHFNHRSEELDTNLIDHWAVTAGCSRRYCNSKTRSPLTAVVSARRAVRHNRQLAEPNSPPPTTQKCGGEG
jgi:hypothetical protein